MIKQDNIKIIGLLVALLASMGRGQFPVNLMTPKTLGLGANLTVRGQNITKSKTPSRESIQIIKLGYAPTSFMVFTAGFGFDRFSVDNHNGREFNGRFGFSPSLSLAMVSPNFIKGKLNIQGGFDVSYLSSEDENEYVYSAAVFNPYAGLGVCPSAFIELSLGARLHILDGNMKDPSDQNENYFSNSQNLRVYTSMTLKSPYEKVFFRFDFNASPDVAQDWSNGPNEASLGMTLGILLGWKERKTPAPERIYFSSYPEIKRVQEQIAEELE